MNRPRHASHPEDRFLDCQAAMEDHFNELMEAAIAAGWVPAEASAAIIELADNYMLKLSSIEETDLKIKEAVERGRGGD